MLKLIYLTKRKPGFSRDEFTCRWRMHGARSMATPFWRHVLSYAQAEPIVPILVPGASGEYDAIAYQTLRDDAFTATRTEEEIASGKMMWGDELETFESNIMPNTILWVTEEQLKPGEPGGVTAFLFFKDAALARAAAESCRGIAAATRVTLNLRDSSSETYGVKSSLPFEAVVELSACDAPALARMATTEAATVVKSADVAVFTRESVFWDRVSDAG